MSIDLLKRRRDLLNGITKEPQLLPDGYTMGLYFNVTKQTRHSFSGLTLPYDVEILIEPTITNSFQCIAGFNGYFMMGINGNKASVGNATTSSNFFSNNTQALLYGQFKSTNSVYYVDGVDTGLRRNARTDYFDTFAGTNFAYAYKGKIFYIKIYKDNKLIRHYVPCKDSNGNGCMCNLITKGIISKPNQTGSWEVV